MGDATRWVAAGLALALCACTPAQETRTDGTARAVSERIDRLGMPLDIYFAPAAGEIEDRIAAEIRGATESVRVAMYNIRSERLGQLLLDKQHDGIEVEVLWDAKQMERSYNTLDDELAERGLEITPVLNERSEYATLHDKLVVIDDETVMLGSGNWGYSGLRANDEAYLVFESAELAAIVDGELDEILSGWKDERSGDIDGPVQLYFSPEDRPDEVIEDQIDAAEERIWVAVFSMRLSWLTDALIRAAGRGVDVRVITDTKQASSTDEDEALREAGIEVVEADNDTTPYTAMHHKFAVIDGQITAVGSYNWSYTGTFKSYEDLALIDDAEVAAAFEGAFGRLWRRYAPGDDDPITGTGTVRVAAHCADTAPGDTLVLVGDVPAIGSWNPRRALALDGADWPTWRGAIELPAGAVIDYKLAIVRGDGRVSWEVGGDRTVVVPTDPDEERVIDGAFRR